MASAAVGLPQSHRKASLPSVPSTSFPLYLERPKRFHRREGRCAKTFGSFSFLVQAASSGKQQNDSLRSGETKKRRVAFAPHLQSSAKTGTNSPDWSPLIKPLVVTCGSVLRWCREGAGGNALPAKSRREEGGRPSPGVLSVCLFFRMVPPTYR